MSTPPRLASAVMVTTGTADNFRVLLVQRSTELKFFGGYWAFPGGASEAMDRTAATLASLSCGVRELLEETCLLPDALGLDLGDANALLAIAADDSCALARWHEAIAAVQQSGSVTEVCRITTPAHNPIRFATDFLRLHQRDAGPPTLDGRELVDWCYLTPAEAVARWQRGEMPIAPPTLLLLELMAAHGPEAFVAPAREAAASFDTGSFHPARFSPGISPHLSPPRPCRRPPPPIATSWGLAICMWWTRRRCMPKTSSG